MSTPLHTEMRISAMWYAWGRQDAQHDPRVDVFSFATYYVGLLDGAHRPSIQDAFATYVAGLS